MARRHGPPPTPTALLKLRGTLDPSKPSQARQFEPKPVGELADMEPPVDLTPSQEEFWRYACQHMPLGVVKAIDREILRAWVEACDRHNTARLMQAMLDRDSKLKLLIKTPDGFAASPYNDILDKTARTMVRLAQELGFSPAARPRIRADAPTIPGEVTTPDVLTDPWAFLEPHGTPN